MSQRLPNSAEEFDQMVARKRAPKRRKRGTGTAKRVLITLGAIAAGLLTIGAIGAIATQDDAAPTRNRSSEMANVVGYTQRLATYIDTMESAYTELTSPWPGLDENVSALARRTSGAAADVQRLRYSGNVKCVRATEIAWHGFAEYIGNIARLILTGRGDDRATARTLAAEVPALQRFAIGVTESCTANLR